MATLYQCDKCSEVLKGQTNPHSVELPPIDGYFDDTDWSKYAKRVDLCNDCLKELYNYFNLSVEVRIDERSTTRKPGKKKR